MATKMKVRKEGRAKGRKVTKTVTKGHQTVRAEAAPATATKKAKLTPTKANGTKTPSLGLSGGDITVVLTKENPYRERTPVAPATGVLFASARRVTSLNRLQFAPPKPRPSQPTPASRT